MCQPAGATAAFVAAFTISTESVSAKAAVGAVTASAGVAVGIFG